MQVVKKGLLIIVVLLLSLAIFAPKRELYYMLEAQLMKNDIIIHNEEIVGGLFTLKLNHPQLYVKGIRVAEVEQIELWSLLFYSRLSINAISVDESIKNLVPTQIDNISISHKLFDPLTLFVDGRGEFGTANGKVMLDNRSVRVNMGDEKLIGKLKPLLKKGDEGWYYETAF